MHKNDGQDLLKAETTLTGKGICLEHDYPPGPAQLGICDQITL